MIPFLFGLACLCLLAIPITEPKPKRKGRIICTYILDARECTFDD